MGGGIYPMVPGHEIVGVVTEIGDKVTKAKVGDFVGIGCIIESCLDCSYCKTKLYNYNFTKLSRINYHNNIKLI